ncbi:MAG: hypothetical protein Q4E57_08825, partial [Eubacteriales bacterium]|nr:hypothetical protein [Eubacteriales bacterium]
MIRMKKESAVIKLAAVICLFAALAFTVKFNSYANTVSVNWSNLSIDTSGSAVWNLSYSGNLVVDKYELKLARKSSGSWNTNYRSATTEDNSYDFSFTSAG